MITFGDLNLVNIESLFVNTLIENDSDEDALSKIELCDLFQNQELIEAFNKRYITPNNINEIISLCDYLMIQNTVSFLRDNVEVILNKHNYNKFYFLNKQNNNNYPNLFPLNQQFIEYNHCNINMTYLHKAIEYGLFKFVKYIIINKPSNYERYNDFCAMAARRGHLNILKLVHSYGCPWGHDSIMYAATNGKLDCLTYLLENKCPFNINASLLCASNGHLDCLKCLHKYGNLHPNCYIYAAEYGYLDCLIYSHKNGGNILHNDDICFRVARSDYLDCLKYLHENGCDWDTKTTYEAIYNGSFSCFKYAIENGCDFDIKKYCIPQIIFHLKEDFKTYLFSLLKIKLTKNQFKKLKQKIRKFNNEHLDDDSDSDDDF